MKSNFERVGEILDRIVPDAHSTKEIVKQIHRLRADYAGLTNAATAPIDYSDVATQAAYAYTYMTANADLIYRTLNLAGKYARDILRRTRVNVVAIGGGPGTELLGVLKFVERQRKSPKRVAMTVMDRQPTWANMWDSTRSTCPAGIDATMTYAPFDWTDPKPLDIEMLAEANILVLSYTLSEVWRYNDDGSVGARLDAIFSALRPGTLMIYSDNGGPNFNPHVDREILARDDLDLIDREDLDHMLIGHDEEKNALARHSASFPGCSPKLTGNATCIALVKLGA